MGLIQQNLESVNFVAGHPTAARTATGQTSGIDVRDYDGDLVFILDSAAGGGSSPTLDVTIEDSADNSSFSALSGAAFTQVQQVHLLKHLKLVQITASVMYGSSTQLEVLLLPLLSQSMQLA